jgi:hypothetical protein
MFYKILYFSVVKINVIYPVNDAVHTIIIYVHLVNLFLWGEVFNMKKKT